MSTINIQYYKTPVGEIILGAFEEQLVLLDYRYRRTRTAVDNRLKKGLKADFVEADSPLLQQTRKQLDQYLSGEITQFDLPILMVGSEFQKSVWQALLQIPYGSSSSYLQLAKKLQNEKAIRAVASANGANAMSVIIPCHRVIGSDGQLVGYAGGLEAKRKLLNLERGIGLTAAEDLGTAPEQGDLPL